MVEGRHFEKRSTARVRRFSSWAIRSQLESTTLLDEQLEDLLPRARFALAAYEPHPEISVALVIVQRLPADDGQPPGFGVGAEWLTILGRAGAEIAVDQYVLGHERGRRDG